MEFSDTANSFRRALAKWYSSAQRPLPWRTDPSLYRTVVSEFMLQQTQIKTMLPYYERWLIRFPDFQTLAAATPETVLKFWEGLGYYSRARNFHKLAQAFIKLPCPPQTAEEWEALPGIGPYSAAAISSIAQNYPAAVVDGNVVRVLARITDDTRSFKNNGEAVKAFTLTAKTALNKKEPGDHNQAMMELGATICLKQNPDCDHCPVKKFCAAHKKSTQHAASLPLINRTPTRKISIDRALLLKDEKILLHQIPKDAARLAGQCELPELRNLAIPTPEEDPIAIKTRAITNNRFRESIYAIDSNLDFPIPTNHQWFPCEDLEKITLSGPHRKWLRELLPTLKPQ
jgi:A/G-specific adenine glycosylase